MLINNLHDFSTAVTHPTVLHLVLFAHKYVAVVVFEAVSTDLGLVSQLRLTDLNKVTRKHIVLIFSSPFTDSP